MQQLTVNEALEQGYDKFCFNSDGFQGLHDICDAEQSDFERADIRIIDKTPFTPSGISAEDIAEMLAEHIEVNHYDNTQDETEAVYKAIKKIDFSDAEAKINEVLLSMFYYRATDIKLIPNP